MTIREPLVVFEVDKRFMWDAGTWKRECRHRQPVKAGDVIVTRGIHRCRRPGSGDRRMKRRCVDDGTGEQ